MRSSAQSLTRLIRPPEKAQDMRIEVLYFDGCPNHKLAVERISDALREEGISADVVEVNVKEASRAQELKFLGSSSIRINGLDVEVTARAGCDYGMMCRTYAVNGRREGSPSREMLRDAIHENSWGVTTPVSGPTTVVAAIIASFCCILPIVFALTGFSILGLRGRRGGCLSAFGSSRQRAIDYLWQLSLLSARILR